MLFSLVRGNDHYKYEERCRTISLDGVFLFSERKLYLVEKSDFLYAKTAIQVVIVLMIVTIETC